MGEERISAMHRQRKIKRLEELCRKLSKHSESMGPGPLRMDVLSAACWLDDYREELAREPS